MRADGVHAALVSLASREGLEAVLRAGQTVRGVIESAPAGLELVVAGNRFSLPANLPFGARQAVWVDVEETAQGLQLRLTPAVPQPAPGEGAPPLLTVLGRILESMGAADAAASAAEGFVPAALARNGEAVRLLLSLFLNRGALAADLEQAARQVARAMDGGALPRSLGEPFLARVNALLAHDAEGLRTMLRHASDAAGRSLESRLAAALDAGLTDPEPRLREDLRALLPRVRDHEGFAAFVRRSGNAEAFERTVDRVLERFAGAQLQNARAPEQGYRFFEFPALAWAGVSSGQVHIFYDRAQGGGGAEPRAPVAAHATVVLDVSTTRLGDLWITFQAAGPFCLCRFQATAQPAVEAIEAAAPELRQALERLGYTETCVETGLWDGDRLRQAAGLMSRLGGIDLRA